MMNKAKKVKELQKNKRNIREEDKNNYGTN